MRSEYLGKKDRESETMCSGFEGFKGPLDLLAASLRSSKGALASLPRLS